MSFMLNCFHCFSVSTESIADGYREGYSVVKKVKLKFGKPIFRLQTASVPLLPKNEIEVLIACEFLIAIILTQIRKGRIWLYTSTGWLMHHL